MKTVGEREVVALIEEYVVYKKVGDWDDIKETESAINSSFKLYVLWAVHPFEHGHNENRNGETHYNDFVDNSDLQIAIHAVVKRREGAACDQYADARVVKATENRIRLYNKTKKLLLDMG